MAKGWGLGTGVAGNSPTYNPPTYQGAGAIAAILTLKNAIEAAGAANNPSGAGPAITNTMVRDALYNMDITTFWGRVAFQPSGQIMGEDDTDASIKPMYATQVQLNNKGEIPVTLPASYASKKDDACVGSNCDTFEFVYPSVTSVAYGEGSSGVGGMAGQLAKAKQDLADEKDKPSYQSAFIACLILNIVLICGIAVFMLRPKANVVQVGMGTNA